MPRKENSNVQKSKKYKKRDKRRIGNYNKYADLNEYIKTSLRKLFSSAKYSANQRKSIPITKQSGNSSTGGQKYCQNEKNN